MDEFDFMNESDNNFNPVENRLQIRESDKEIKRNRFRRKRDDIESPKRDVLSPTKKDVVVDESLKKRDIIVDENLNKKDVLSPTKRDVLPIVKKESDKEKKQKAYVELMKKKALEEKEKRKQFEKKQKQTILATDKKEKEQVKQYEYRVKQKEKKEHKEQKDKKEAKEKADLKKKKEKAIEEKKEKDKIKEDLKVETEKDKEKRHKEEAKYLKQKQELEESIISKIGILQYNMGSSYMDSVLTALFVVAIEEFEACLNKPVQFVGHKEDLRKEEKKEKEKKEDDKEDKPIELKKEDDKDELIELKKDEPSEPGFFQKLFSTKKSEKKEIPKKMISEIVSDDSNELRAVNLEDVDIQQLKEIVHNRIKKDFDDINQEIPNNIKKLLKRFDTDMDEVEKQGLTDEAHNLYQQCILDLDNIYTIVEQTIDSYKEEKDDEQFEDVDIPEDIVEQKRNEKEERKNDKKGYDSVQEPKAEGFFDRISNFFKPVNLDPEGKYEEQISDNTIKCIAETDTILTQINIDTEENKLSEYLEQFKKCLEFIASIKTEHTKQINKLKQKMERNINTIEDYILFVPIRKKYNELFTGDLKDDSDIDSDTLKTFISDCTVLQTNIREIRNKLNKYINHAKQIQKEQEKLQKQIPSRKELSCYDSIKKRYSDIKNNLTIKDVNILLRDLQNCDEPKNKKKIDDLITELEDKQEILLKQVSEEKYPHDELELSQIEQKEYNPFIDNEIQKLVEEQRRLRDLHQEQIANNEKRTIINATYEQSNKITNELNKLRKEKQSQMSFTSSYCMLTTPEAVANILKESGRTITTDSEKDRFLTEYFKNLQITFVKSVQNELNNIKNFVRGSEGGFFERGRRATDVSQLRNHFKSCQKYIEFGDITDEQFKVHEEEQKKEEEKERKEELKKQKKEQKAEMKRQEEKNRKRMRKIRERKYEESDDDEDEEKEDEEKKLKEERDREAKEKRKRKQEKENIHYRQKSGKMERDPSLFLRAIFDIINFRIDSDIPIIYNSSSTSLSSLRINENYKNFLIYETKIQIPNLEYIINDCELYCMVVYNGSNFTCSYRPLRITKCVYTNCKNPAQYGRNKENRCEIHKKKDDSKLEYLNWYSINDKFTTIEKIENVNANNTQLFFYRKMQPQTKEKQKEPGIVIKTPAPYRYRNRFFGMQNNDDDDDNVFRWN